MAKYGERISGRPSYLSHRQNYPQYSAGLPPTSSTTSGTKAAATVREDEEAADSTSGLGNSSSVVGGTLSQRDPVYPRSLAEEVLWRQRRFAWWGTTYLVDPVAIPFQQQRHQSHNQIIARLLQHINNKDVSHLISPSLSHANPSVPFKGLGHSTKKIYLVGLNLAILFNCRYLFGKPNDV